MAEPRQSLEQSASGLSDNADRRTQLAADRTALAAERTFAAWIRTGLGALASGVGARALLGPVLPAWMVAATCSVLIAFSGFCFAAAVWRESAGFAITGPDTRKLPVWLIVGTSGFLVLVSIAALVGVWAGGWKR